MEQNQVEKHDQINEVLKTHEPYFKFSIKLNTYPVFCGDDRNPLFEDMYLHVFGGAANTAYNAEVLARATEEGVRSESFKSAITKAAKAFDDAGIAAGVHSDAQSETGKTIDPGQEGDIGCGYIKLRREISRQIAANANNVVIAAESSRPDLFTDPSDTSFAHDIIKAHAKLAADDRFFSDGSRVIARAAIAEGAPIMLVAGDHGANTGIINYKKDSTIDSKTAFQDGQSIYEHDAWASEEMAGLYGNAKPFAGKQWQIADLIDAIGTMQALGVHVVAVRH